MTGCDGGFECVSGNVLIDVTIRKHRDESGERKKKIITALFILSLSLSRSFDALILFMKDINPKCHL